ncbi:MAG TPA: hypothetical protein ENI31_01510 [Candidatus Omnitrophica bacterium]|nr:MAG: hypothetical protein DRP61_00340 [Candidatus Omnitrophota bacterium]RKY34921.1 MAG: hypothetical protein DRP69_03290 [Candidatus Omnitrophota bacterium]RKY44792.1 MAG: hypothetical protein DRP80_01095 [Candidatus Omnitrophota bacterium]HEC68954.1 hypothetical protein [Candidatus Omnitrophota bacterium]
MRDKNFKIIILLVSVLFLEGCFLIQLPFQLVSGVFKTTFGIIGGALNLLGKIPLPPPGVF